MYYLKRSKRLMALSMLMSFVLALVLVTAMHVQSSNAATGAKSAGVSINSTEVENTALNADASDNDPLIESIWGKIWGAIKRAAKAVNDFMCNYLPQFWPSILC